MSDKDRELLHKIENLLSQGHNEESPWIPGFEAKPLLKEIREHLSQPLISLNEEEIKPTLKDFAIKAGVTLVDVGPGWRGKWGFTTKDHPNSTACGYRTKAAVYKGWATSTFGKHAAKALFKLLGEK